MQRALQERTFRAVGQPLRRKEDYRLLTGQGRFTDDFSLPNQTWAAMVRPMMSNCSKPAGEIVAPAAPLAMSS